MYHQMLESCLVRLLQISTTGMDCLWDVCQPACCVIGHLVVSKLTRDLLHFRIWALLLLPLSVTGSVNTNHPSLNLRTIYGCGAMLLVMATALLIKTY